MCNHENAICVESTGGIAAGRFKEKYECPCGAEGWIYGNAEDDPSNWDRFGEVFR